MYVQDRCTIIAKYSIYNFTITSSLLWSGNRTKTLYSEVAIRTIYVFRFVFVQKVVLSLQIFRFKIDFGKDRS